MRPVLALLLLVVGAVTGMAAVLLHTYWWGLVLGLAATLATAMALPGAWWGRLPFALGWVVALGYALVQRPEGDFLVADGGAGYVLLVAGLVLGVWGAVGLRRGPAS